MARAKGVDLVEVGPGADPPVCRMVEYGKYRYDEQRRMKEQSARKTAQEAIMTTTLLTVPGIPAKALQKIQLELIERYQEPHRRWHTLGHVFQMQEILCALTREGDAVLNCACWFHDAVYVPGRPDNEELSAELAREALGSLAEAEFVEQVVKCILATERHVQHEDLETRVGRFIDADLAILASPAEEYDFYRAAIRAEYEQVEDAQFYAGRASFLRAYLKRERLFSGNAPGSWEGKARRNMERELGEIETE